jgi:hypothetical protein
MGDVFRLRGVDVYRVLSCVAIDGAGPEGRGREHEQDVLARVDEFARRLAASRDYEEATRVALQSLDDLFGFRQSILLVADEAGARLFAVASNGYPDSPAGAEAAFGVGVIGTAAERRRVISVSNLVRSRAMQAAVRDSVELRGGELPGDEIELPGRDRARSAAAVPLVAQGSLTGVLYLESDEIGRFGPQDDRLLRILGAQLAATLRALELDRDDGEEPDASPLGAPAATGDTLTVTYYQADDSVFVTDEYVVKGVPGRILWKLLREHAADGRDVFTNRELRLDESLGLPPGNDNLEARLLVLRRRLEGGKVGLALERVGRGRLALRVAGPLDLVEVPTSGPMRAAHVPREAE